MSEGPAAGPATGLARATTEDINLKLKDRQRGCDHMFPHKFKEGICSKTAHDTRDGTDEKSYAMLRAETKNDELDEEQVMWLNGETKPMMDHVKARWKSCCYDTSVVSALVLHHEATRGLTCFMPCVLASPLLPITFVLLCALTRIIFALSVFCSSSCLSFLFSKCFLLLCSSQSLLADVFIVRSSICHQSVLPCLSFSFVYILSNPSQPLEALEAQSKSLYLQIALRSEP